MDSFRFWSPQGPCDRAGPHNDQIFLGSNLHSLEGDMKKSVKVPMFISAIWLWLTVRHGKIHRIFKFGKPFIFHGELLVITRLGTAKSASTRLFRLNFYTSPRSPKKTPGIPTWRWQRSCRWIHPWGPPAHCIDPWGACPVTRDGWDLRGSGSAKRWKSVVDSTSIPMDPSTFLGSVWGIIYYNLEA